jgi:hypothetical protein
MCATAPKIGEQVSGDPHSALPPLIWGVPGGDMLFRKSQKYGFDLGKYSIIYVKELASRPCSQSFNAPVRMAAEVQLVVPQKCRSASAFRSGCLCHSIDGRAHRAGTGRSYAHSRCAVPDRALLGEDLPLPPGSRGLFELSTSPAYPLPVKATTASACTSTD